MAVPITAAFVLGGLVLAFAGVKIFDIAVTVTGFVGGAGIGFGLANASGDPSTLVLAVAVIAGGIIGAVLLWNIIKLIVMAPGFVAGAGVVFVAIGPKTFESLNKSGGFGWLALVVAGLIGAVIAWKLFRIMIAVVTSFLGAAMVSISSHADTIVDAAMAGEPNAVPAVSFTLVFWAVFGLGVLSQLGQVLGGLTSSEESG